MIRWGGDRRHVTRRRDQRPGMFRSWRELVLRLGAAVLLSGAFWLLAVVVVIGLAPTP